MMKKVIYLSLGLVFFVYVASAQKKVTLGSPKGLLNAVISIKNGYIDIEVLKRGVSIMGVNSIATNHEKIDRLNQVSDKLTSLAFINEFSTKNRNVDLSCKQYTFDIGIAKKLEVLLFDNMITYRFILNNDNNEIKEESFVVDFKQNGKYYSTIDADVVHSSSEYSYSKIDFLKNVPKKSELGMPIVLETFGDKRHIFLVAEANVNNFPLTYFEKEDNFKIRARQPMQVVETSKIGAPKSRVEKIVSRATYAAKIKSAQNGAPLPWRIFGIFDSDLDLISNDVIIALSDKKSDQIDYSWVKPGRAIWDWWSARGSILDGHKIGIDTRSYQLLIDFASKFSIEYLIMDGGWSKGISQQKFQYSKGVDMNAIVKKGKDRGVGIFLWILWKDMENKQQMISLLDQLKSLGIAGIKLDFIDRSDVDVVEFYETIARECAKRKLMVIFHGSYPPTGLERKYPNVVTYEAVRGLEYNKWSKGVSPIYNVTIPFTRMFLGNMDYTPGAFNNVSPNVFKPNKIAPSSQGTVAHNVAQCVVYESFIQTLSDRPENYLKHIDRFKFVLEIPTTWNKTIPLKGIIGDYLVVARENRENWYIGGMNGGKGKTVSIKLDFIENKPYSLKFIDDSGDINIKRVKKGDTINLNFVSFGGWCGILTPLK